MKHLSQLMDEYSTYHFSDESWIGELLSGNSNIPKPKRKRRRKPMTEETDQTPTRDTKGRYQGKGGRPPGSLAKKYRRIDLRAVAERYLGARRSPTSHPTRGFPSPCCTPA